MASASDRTQEIDLLKLALPIRRRLGRFVLVWALLALVLGAAVLQLRPKFASRGSLYLEEAQESGMTSLLPMFGSGSDIDSQKQVLKSDELALSMIRACGLAATLEGEAALLPDRPRLWQWLFEPTPARFERGLFVRDTQVEPGVYEPVELTIEFIDSDTFTATPAAGGDAVEGRLGQPVAVGPARFTLDHHGGAAPSAGASLAVELQPARAVLEDFHAALSVEGGGRPPMRTNLIYVGYTSGSPQRSRQVVASLMEAFTELNHRWNTRVSRATLSFVDSQVGELEQDMEGAFERLARFQERSGLVSLEPQLEEDLQGLVELEVQQRRARLKLHALEQLASSLEQGAGQVHLSTFIEEPLVASMAKRLTELDAQIASMRSDYHEDYPPLKQTRIVREQVASDLQQTVGNFVEQSRRSVAELGNSIEQYRGRFKDLPAKSKSLAEYTRSAKVFEELYLQLLREKQKARVAQASTLSNLHVVDEPGVALEPIWPNLMSLAGGAWAGGFVLAYAFVAAPQLRVKWFTSVQELEEASGRPVFAALPRRMGRRASRATPAVLEARAGSGFSEAVRLLRANLLQTMGDRQQMTLLLTSATAGDGKTSVAANLAVNLIHAQRVERVLLIDADMHHPAVHGVFNLPQSPGLSDYLNGRADLEEIIQTVALESGQTVDVIPAGPVPPVPADLVETLAMQRLLDEARRRYGFVVIDAPPYPLVASAAILAPKVDRVLSVCSLNKTPRQAFLRHAHDLAQANRSLALVANMLPVRGGEYGYGYGEQPGTGQGAGPVLQRSNGKPRRTAGV